MTSAEWIGAVGVSLILFAFAAQQFGRLDSSSRLYLVANAFGAGLACLSSLMIGFWPFVILEGAWSVVAIWGLIATVRRAGRVGPRT